MSFFGGGDIGHGAEVVDEDFAIDHDRQTGNHVSMAVSA